jgi:hypothetical protein
MVKFPYREPPSYRMSLSDIGVIIAIMRVLVVELLCQAVTGWIPTLKCLLPGAHGHMWLHLIFSGIKWLRYSRTPTLRPLARYLGYPGHGYRGPETGLVSS